MPRTLGSDAKKSSGISSMTPFETVLGAQFHHLNAQIRQLHGGRAPVWRGQVSVETGRGLLSRLAARLAGLPPQMENAPFVIGIEGHADGTETWTRQFGAHRTRSRIAAGADGTHLEESFGAVQLRLLAQVKVDALHVSVSEAHAFGVRVPGALTPRSACNIWQDEAGRYRFDIKATLGTRTPIVRYFGWLRPDVQSAFVDG